MFNFFKKNEIPKKPKIQFPPVPEWKPLIDQPLEKVAGHIRFYTNGLKDFAIFLHGTVVVLPEGLSNQDAEAAAIETLYKVFHAHPDMHPLAMKDGNTLVRYNYDVSNLVLEETAIKHWNEIDKNHQQALTTNEVLMTSLGKNTFDDFGKKSLFGRCFMFMDAQNPKVVKIERANES